MTINMMQRAILASVLCALILGGTAMAQVSAQEAEQLKTTLTPMGAEKAGNKEGTIPAWDGGATKVTPGFKNGGKRPDPYPNEKALFLDHVQEHGPVCRQTDGSYEGPAQEVPRFPGRRLPDASYRKRAAVGL